MPRATFLLCLSALLFAACNKETPAGEQKHCWQMVDFLGNDLTMICDKTEQELKDCTKNETCGTWSGTGTGELQYCNYFNVDDPTFCWIIDELYYTGRSEKSVECWNRGSNKVKVECNITCGNWRTRRKATHKSTGFILLSNISTRRAICGDTAIAFKTLAPYIIKNTADSLVVIQYSPDDRNWY